MVNKLNLEIEPWQAKKRSLQNIPRFLPQTGISSKPVYKCRNDFIKSGKSILKKSDIRSENESLKQLMAGLNLKNRVFKKIEGFEIGLNLNLRYTHFKIFHWEWYYLSTVPYVFSLYIITCQLCKTMSSDDVRSVSGVAIDRTGVTRISEY
jgi:hypothetical protein